MTIRCYKTYRQPQAIGFDLDDTLYDNKPVLEQAESKLLCFLHENFPKSTQYGFKDWLDLRNRVISLKPGLINDTSASRLAALRLGLQTLGYDQEIAQDGALAAFNEFIYWRNNVKISDDIHQLLRELKQYFTLFVISNGNANITSLGIETYFEFALHPSEKVAMKPDNSLFELAEQRLQLPSHRISYVGDHPVSDVVGANNAGWQSIWLNEKQSHLNHYKKPLQLPAIELTSIEQLRVLIPQ